MARTSGVRRRLGRCRSTASGWRACPGSHRRTHRSSVSTRRRPVSPPLRAQSRSSWGSAGGRRIASARSSSSCPTMPRNRRSCTRSPTTSRRARGSSPTTVGGSTGRCWSPATALPGTLRPSTPATSTCCRSSAACSATAWRMPACARQRRRCSGSTGSATSTAGRSRAATSTSCGAGLRIPSSRSSATTTRTSGRSPTSSGTSSGGTPMPRRVPRLRRAISRGWPVPLPASSAWTRRSSAWKPRSALRSRNPRQARACPRGDRAPASTTGGNQPIGRTSAACRAGRRRSRRWIDPRRSPFRGPRSGCSSIAPTSCEGLAASRLPARRGPASSRHRGGSGWWPRSRWRSSANTGCGT